MSCESILNGRGSLAVTVEAGRIVYQYTKQYPLAWDGEISDMAISTAWVIQKAADENWPINKFIRNMIAVRLANDEYYEKVILPKAYGETPKTPSPILKLDLPKI